ncbi:MAG: hypothetical protein COT34_02750 [Candidatus Nealsonbacteria bacterium CG08_land_8_20_14_0_20_43_11]|uniref:Uncharacterized protein n=1 Tax=Candidatus Nealsonbacteria bacterium CG08_land_8_20_14_0_20_43_11 TaxID=1974706 RepID=A0A2M6T0A8_9BACT|nr:MAG: hypothetical protein COT34_02750 [Candidatus Nealsonbacteria bacterium CG08_land_8_20_14_0_20_43_11]
MSTPKTKGKSKIATSAIPQEPTTRQRFSYCPLEEKNQDISQEIREALVSALRSDIANDGGGEQEHQNNAHKNPADGESQILFTTHVSSCPIGNKTIHSLP